MTQTPIQLDKNETRELILSAASELFLKQGYSQTSTREIAKKVNMTQPGLYHYFNDKQHLFVEVVQAVAKVVNQDMIAILQESSQAKATQLTQMTQAIIDRHPKDVFSLIHGSFNELKPEHQRSLGMIFGRYYIAPIADFFEQVTLRQQVDAKMAASFYITSLSPLFGEFHAINGAKTRDEQVAMLVDLILHGVSTTEK